MYTFSSFFLPTRPTAFASYPDQGARAIFSANPPAHLGDL